MSTKTPKGKRRVPGPKASTPFSRNLLRLRTAKKFTQAELARKVGASDSQICLYEKGFRKPSLLRCVKIASALGCTLNYLLTNCKKSTSPK